MNEISVHEMAEGTLEELETAEFPSEIPGTDPVPRKFDVTAYAKALSVRLLKVSAYAPGDGDKEPGVRLLHIRTDTPMALYFHSGVATDAWLRITQIPDLITLEFNADGKLRVMDNSLQAKHIDPLMTEAQQNEFRIRIGSDHLTDDIGQETVHIDTANRFYATDIDVPDVAADEYLIVNIEPSTIRYGQWYLILNAEIHELTESTDGLALGIGDFDHILFVHSAVPQTATRFNGLALGHTIDHKLLIGLTGAGVNTDDFTIRVRGLR